MPRRALLELILFFLLWGLLALLFFGYFFLGWFGGRAALRRALRIAGGLVLCPAGSRPPLDLDARTVGPTPATVRAFAGADPPGEPVWFVGGVACAGRPNVASSPATPGEFEESTFFAYRMPITITRASPPSGKSG